VTGPEKLVKIDDELADGVEIVSDGTIARVGRIGGKSRGGGGGSEGRGEEGSSDDDERGGDFNHCKWTK
jgi:hypothetical protein